MPLILVGLAAGALLVPSTTLPAAAGVRPLPRLLRSRVPLLQADADRPLPFAFLQNDVPKDQQPVFELRSLRSQPFYDWADTDDGYKANLRNLYAGIMLLLSLPVSYNLPFELPAAHRREPWHAGRDDSIRLSSARGLVIRLAAAQGAVHLLRGAATRSICPEGPGDADSRPADPEDGGAARPAADRRFARRSVRRPVFDRPQRRGHHRHRGREWARNAEDPLRRRGDPVHQPAARRRRVRRSGAGARAK